MDDDSNYSDENDIDIVDNTFFIIQHNPIIDISTNAQLKDDFLNNALAELKRNTPLHTLGVHHMTISEFLSIEEEAGDPLKKARKYLKKACNEDIKHNLSLGYPLHKLNPFCAPILEEAVRINWELPDKILLEHFKQFLKANRPNFADDDDYEDFLKKCHRKPNPAEWQRLGVLPYIDLSFWAWEAGICIPNRVMADAIYPMGEGGEDTVRKTTSQLAIKLLTQEMIDALAHYAALEIMEKNKK